MKNKKSIILYVDIISTFESLEDDEAGRLIKHILRYVNDLNPIAPDKLTQIAFEPIKQQLKRDLQKWDLIKEKRSEAGKASAEKRKQASTNPTFVENVQQVSTNPTVSVNDSVTVNVNDNVNVKKEKNIIVDKKSPIDFYFVNPEFQKTFFRWLDYKKEKKQTYKSQDSLEACYKLLLKDSKNNSFEAEKIIENAIAKNYSGFFPLNTSLTPSNQQNGTKKPSKLDGIIAGTLENMERSGIDTSKYF